MIKKFFERLFDVLYPKDVACLICDVESDELRNGICDKCELKFVPYIGRFAIPEIDCMRSALVYNEDIAPVIARFKRSGQSYLGVLFAQYMELDDDWRIDAIIPVPIHRIDENRRGYNQSEIIAAELSKRYGIPLHKEYLVKTKRTKNQKKLDKKGRTKNLRNAFTADISVKGKSILLVDDVRTTGSTLKECAVELRKKGAARIYAITCFATVIT